MGYSETIKNVITNITTQNDIYVNITSTTRMHIYIKKILIKHGI